jgi:hypothetical protein
MPAGGQSGTEVNAEIPGLSAETGTIEGGPRYPTGINDHGT